MNVGPIDGDNNTVGHHNTVNSNNNTVVITNYGGIGLFSAFILFVLLVGVGGMLLDLLAQFIVPLMLILAVVMVCWAIHRDLEEKAKAKAELAARADAENAAYTAGDYRGIFGQFPPDRRAQ